jgi:hypothetical protein
MGAILNLEPGYVVLEVPERPDPFQPLGFSASRRRLEGSETRYILETSLAEEFDEILEPVAHPLTAAGRYLVQTDPVQALNFVASTRGHWGSIPLAESLELHTRVLRLSLSDSAARRQVEAMVIFLNAVNGSRWASDQDVLSILEREIRERDPSNAALICSAISICAQQGGQLERANRFAHLRGRLLSRSHSPEARPRGDYAIANIERHCGRYEAARSRNLDALRTFEELGCLDEIGFAHLTASTDAIWAGEFDLAEQHVQKSGNLFGQTQNVRLKPWAQMSKAFLLESVGDLPAAHQILMNLQHQAKDRSGQIFRAGVEDHLLRVHCKMGEWEMSTHDWAAAIQIRSNLGVVTSPFEKALLRQAKQKLKEQVGVDSLRSSFQMLQRA